MNNSHGIFCSGIGSANLAISSKGSELKFAIDNHPLAYDIFEENFGGDGLVFANVQDIDYSVLPDVEILYAFPPCLFTKTMENDNNQREIARSIVYYALEHRPKTVCVISNDKYVDSEYGLHIKYRLYQAGYDPHIYKLRAQDYAVPSTRIYSVIIMTLSNEFMFPISIPKRKAKRGWKESLEDIVYLFDEWVLTPKLWEKVVKSVSTSNDRTFPVIVRSNNECQPYNGRVHPLQHPVMLNDTDGGYRRHLWVTDDMEARVFNTRAYARINTIPDTMIIPELRMSSDIYRLVSDAIPYNLMAVVHNSICQAYDFWEDRYNVN